MSLRNFFAELKRRYGSIRCLIGSGTINDFRN